MTMPSLRRDLFRPRTVVPVAVAVGGLALAARVVLGISPRAIWAELIDADPVLLVLAVAVFYLIFPVRALRWRTLLENTGLTNLPPLGRLTRMLVLGSFANSVSVAQLGDVYRGYLLEQEAGVPLPTTLGTIVAERLVDLVTLVALLAGAALTVYSGRLPQDGAEALFGGLALALAGLIALLLLPRSRRLVERVLPARWHVSYARFEQGAVRSLRRLPLLLGYSVAGWLIEGATLLLLAAAVGVDLSTSGALVAALVASLLSVEPLTPGGLGATEPGIVLVLTSVGVGAAGASAIALLNRLVNYASLAVAGGVLALLPARPRLLALKRAAPAP
jgi:glycosyltransferase 2 family protein